MPEFHLDTSGAVERPADYKGWGVERALTWADLDAFTQGYVEAVFFTETVALDESELEAYIASGGEDSFRGTPRGFSDLAPETLLSILKDCAELRDFFKEGGHREPTREDGRTFWQLRQYGQLPSDPPLTVTLGDDGKAYLS